MTLFVSAALLASALSSAAIYWLYFAGAFPLTRYFATPLLDLGKLTGHGQEAAVVFMAANTALFLLYGLVVALARQAQDQPVVRWLIVAAPLVYVLILLFAFPIGAIDVYDYAFHAKMLGQYHASPLAHLPSEFAADPWFNYIAWKDATSPYGPVWVYLSASIYWLAGADLLRNLLAFKLLAGSSLLACAGLVCLIVRRVRPRDALAAFALVAWNPLLLGEMAMNGHNDVLMTALVLVALWRFQARQYALSILVLVVAALVKAPAAVLLPVLVTASLRGLPARRERAQFVWQTLGGTLIVLPVLYLPLLGGTNPLASLIAHSDLFTTSPAAVVWHALALRLDADNAKELVRLGALGLFGVLYLWQLWRTDSSFTSVVRAVVNIVLLMLTLITFWFQPWYLVWLAPLAALSARSDQTLAALFSWSALWGYFIFDFAWLWNVDFFNQGDSLVLNASAMLLIFTPPALYWLYGARNERAGQSERTPTLQPALHN